MAVDVVGLLDPDLLQLCPGVASPSSCRPAASEKLLDDLFNQWLSLPDTQRMVRLLNSLSLSLSLNSGVGDLRMLSAPSNIRSHQMLGFN
jgi:hypothetical protein